MTVPMDMARLRRLRAAIDNAQAHVRELTDRRDEIIADMLIEQVATGSVIGEAAGVSQPRVVQIKNAVVIRRETAAAELAAAKEARRAKRKRNRELVSAS